MEKCELKVTPIYKSGDKNDPNNYRSISVLRVNFKSNNNNNNNNNNNSNSNNDNNDNNDLEIAHPQSGSSSTLFLVELEFGNFGF